MGVVEIGKLLDGATFFRDFIGSIRVLGGAFKILKNTVATKIRVGLCNCV